MPIGPHQLGPEPTERLEKVEALIDAILPLRQRIDGKVRILFKELPEFTDQELLGLEFFINRDYRTCGWSRVFVKAVSDGCDMRGEPNAAYAYEFWSADGMS